MAEEINFNEIDGEELDAMKQEAASHKLEKEEQKEASKAKEEVEKAQGEVEPTKKDTGKNEGTDDGYEKFCFICRRICAIRKNRHFLRSWGILNCRF